MSVLEYSRQANGCDPLSLAFSWLWLFRTANVSGSGVLPGLPSCNWLPVVGITTLLALATRTYAHPWVRCGMGPVIQPNGAA